MFSSVFGHCGWGGKKSKIKPVNYLDCPVLFIYLFFFFRIRSCGRPIKWVFHHKWPCLRFSVSLSLYSIYTSEHQLRLKMDSCHSASEVSSLLDISRFQNPSLHFPQAQSLVPLARVNNMHQAKDLVDENAPGFVSLFLSNWQKYGLSFQTVGICHWKWPLSSVSYTFTLRPVEYGPKNTPADHSGYLVSPYGQELPPA